MEDRGGGRSVELSPTGKRSSSMIFKVSPIFRRDRWKII